MYYKRHRTTSKPAKQQLKRSVQTRPVIKADRDERRARQRYLKLSREELVNQILLVEQQYAELNTRYLVMNDKLLEWQLRAEQAEALLNAPQEPQWQEAGKSLSPKPRHRPRAESTTGPLPKHLVSLLAFAGHHNVAETKVQTHVDIGLLLVEHGEWMESDGAVVTLALDKSGRQAFYELYREVPPFLACTQYPTRRCSPLVGRQNRDELFGWKQRDRLIPSVQKVRTSRGASPLTKEQRRRRRKVVALAPLMACLG